MELHIVDMLKINKDGKTNFISIQLGPKVSGIKVSCSKRIAINVTSPNVTTFIVNPLIFLLFVYFQIYCGQIHLP